MVPSQDLAFSISMVLLRIKLHAFRFRPPELRCDNMRLLTHNLLSSHVRGVGTRGFPLRLQATEVRINLVEFNLDFVARMIPKVEWAALVQAVDTLNLAEVPKEPTEGYERDETFLRKMYHVLLEVDVLEGTLQCPESSFPHQPRDPQHAVE